MSSELVIGSGSLGKLISGHLVIAFLPESHPSFHLAGEKDPILACFLLAHFDDRRIRMKFELVITHANETNLN